MQNEIIEYDAHRITPETRNAVNRLLAQKGSSFEQSTISRVSQAAAPLAAWVTANLQYADVLQKVAPLEQELGGLTANYTQSQVLSACQTSMWEPCSLCVWFTLPASVHAHYAFGVTRSISGCKCTHVVYIVELFMLIMKYRCPESRCPAQS